MRSSALLAIALLAISPALCAAKEVIVSARAESDSVADKASAVQEALEKVVLELLDEEGVSHRFDRRARNALIESCRGLLKKVRWRVRRGRARLSAAIEREDIRANVHTATGAAARAPVKLDVRCKGAEVADSQSVLQAGLGARLATSKVKVSAKAKKRVQVKVTLIFETFPEGSAAAAGGYLGYFRVRGDVKISEGGVSSGAFVIRSDRRLSDLSTPPGQDVLPQPVLHKGGSRVELEGRYLQYMGEWLAIEINKSLNKGGGPASRIETVKGELSGFDAAQAKSFLAALSQEIGITGVALGEAGTFSFSHAGHSLKGKLEAALLHIRLAATVTAKDGSVKIVLP
jgi:hypothetical protein